MFRKALIVAVAAVVIGGVGAGCSSDDDSSDSATTTTAGANPSAMLSSAKATASSVVSSVADTAKEALQDAINTVLASAPISFQPDSSDLTAVGSTTIRAIAVILKDNESTVVIKTYASNSDADTAKALAEERGSNIVAAFDREGVDKSRISVEATGNPRGDGQEIDNAEITVAAR